MFRLLDRHVLLEWLKILGLVVAASLAVLVIFLVYDTFRDLREFDATPAQMFEYYLVRAPANLAFVVPIAVLVSLLYALGRMHRNNEFTAIRAAGVGLLRITGWIWVAVIALSAVLFHLTGSVIPWSVERSRLMLDNLRFAKQAAGAARTDGVGLVNNVTYHDRTAGRMWMIARFSRYSNRAFGVQVSFLGAAGREERRLVAAEGFWDETAATWTLLRGRETLFDAARGDISRSIAFERMELAGVADDPGWMLLLEKRPKDLSFFELRRIVGSPEVADHPRLPAYAVRYHSLLAGGFSCLIVAGLAIPFAVTGVRVNPAVGVSKSLALFFLFYLLSTIGSMLGEQGTVPPWFAAWIPNGAMAGLAAVLMVRMR